MTSEQYYWFIRRQQVLRAYAANNAKPEAAGADKFISVATPEEFRNAFLNAKDGDVIKITSLIVLADEQESILIDKNVRVNLNGQTIVATHLAGNTKDAVFAIKRGGTLTIDGDGVINGSLGGTVGYALKTTVKGEDAEGEYAKLIINGGTVRGKYSAITGNGGRQNTDVTINGGIFEGTYPSDNYAYYHPENGTLTINGGDFSGNDCVIIKSGVVKITGGVFKSNGEAKAYIHNRSGWNCTGDCIAVEACDYPGSLPSIEITGGTFSSVNGKPVASYSQNVGVYPRILHFIKGGKFNKEIDTDLIATGYKQELINGWYVVKPM